MSIYDALIPWNKNLRNWPGDYGVEIETETKEAYIIPKFSFWDIHADGSLRDFGQEYVLRHPLKFDKELPEALEEFKKKTDGIKFRKDSVTTSVHVHVNFLNETWKTLFNFITVYTLVENLLIHFSGESRRSNGFCLPICDAEETFNNICKMVNNVSARGNLGSIKFSPDSVKYAALNLGSLYAIGSLEIRSYHGTTDTEEIYRWVGIINKLKTYAKNPALNPTIFVKEFDKIGVKILDEIFGEYRKDLYNMNEQKLLEKNFWYAAQIAHSTKDWDSMDKELKKAPSRKSKVDIDALAIHEFGEPFMELSTDNQRWIRERMEDIELGVRENPLTPVQRTRQPRAATPMFRIEDGPVLATQPDTTANGQGRHDAWVRAAQFATRTNAVTGNTVTAGDIQNLRPTGDPLGNTPQDEYTRAVQVLNNRIRERQERDAQRVEEVRVDDALEDFPFEDFTPEDED